MNTKRTHVVCPAVPTQGQSVLKIGIDAHADQYVVATQIDGSAPKPPQRFDREGLLRWIRQKLAEGFAVFSCYEAGPFGFWLHRRLVELGVTNYVIRPRDWDDQRKGVKTDRTDARAMLCALDRFVAGNARALAVVRVPTLAQEQRRSESRVREALQRSLKAMAQRGRSLALEYGYRLEGLWYGERRWPKLEVPIWLRDLLEPLREAALALRQQARTQTTAVEKASQGALPHGMGPLSQQILEREVGDWSRFGNRRQVSSFLGLCPGEHSSGRCQKKGSITKTGNGRVRALLIQIAWRLWARQPQYWLVRKWLPQFGAPGLGAGRRKQIVVALARGFAVDWWRLRTGQTTPEKLGLAMAS